VSDLLNEDSLHVLERLAPFRIVWSETGEVLDISNKVRSFLEWDGGDDVSIYLIHPYRVVLTPEILDEITNMTLHVGLDQTGERFLRGEVLKMGKGAGWLFTGIPPIAATKSMAEMGVNLRDLPLHMGVTDFIVANEAAHVALADAKRSNDVLAETSEQLRNRTELLEQKSIALVEQIRKHEFVSTRLEEALQELEITQDALVRQERYKALGEMVSGIAHDFNNMLTPILSYSAILKEEPDIPIEERDQFLDWIMTAACDASELIKRLRRLYSPDLSSGQLRYFDVSRVVDDALALALPRWSSKLKGGANKILVDREYEKDLTVFGAESDVRQAILNLLVNAGDAMPEGGNLNIKTSGSEHEVLISVQDTGIGMDVDTLVRCRSVFFSTKGERGSGLGLPMVSNTAVRHGGRVEVESSLGMGSAFHLFLSRDSSSIEIDDGSQPETLVSTSESPWGTSKGVITSGGSGLGTQRRLLKSGQIESLLLASEKHLARQIRLLIVDDDPGASAALLHLGEKLGVECHARESAEEGLVFLKNNMIDVLIADVDMPNLRGDDFAVLVRDAFEDIAVLLYTGRPESVKAHGRTASDHVLGKPMEARDVLLVCMVTLAERLGVEASYE